MNVMKKMMTRATVGLAVAAVLSGCAMEEPFGAGQEGDLTLLTEIRGDVTKHTRAIEAEELGRLRDKCIVYIENSRGVVRKFKGLDNIPERIRLQTGEYVAEAWSGDSVSASFDAKFYRGYQKFEVGEGQNSLTLRCNIANVIVSLDASSLDVNLTDLKVTFSHSRGELVFTPENISTAKGYFMMPNADKDVLYKIEGRMADGSDYEKTGVISNVQRAHEYCMTISEDEKPITEGGALIRVTIADIPVIEDEIEIFPAPAVQGVGFNMAAQVSAVDKPFEQTRVYVRGYFGLSSLVMNVSDNFTSLQSGQNILESSVQTALASRGVLVERRTSTDAAPSLDAGEVTVDEVYITFSKAFLESLAPSSKEYNVSFEATDGRHNVGVGSLRLANTSDALEFIPPVVTISNANDLLAVRAHSATLSGEIYDDAAASNYGVRYRVQGTSAWTNVYPTRSSRANGGVYSVTLSGLTAGTTYEYQAFSDGYDDAEIRSFTTESPFNLVNASFEQWSTYQASTLLGTKTVTLPGQEGNKQQSFWGSGNEGAATADATLTDKSTDMVHSGTYSARLESKVVMSIPAAGNIFIGYYVETDGTNGVLGLGRQYNGSHPSKVRVWANYRPGSNVKIKSGSESFVQGELTAGGTDQGQIYVALTDETVEIRTNPSKRKVFDVNDTHVLAYGQVTWKEAFGPDGELKLLEIPLDYKEKARTTQPTHIIIVASASKFGDYFAGSAGSVMYLDDFELVYE